MKSRIIHSGFKARNVLYAALTVSFLLGMAARALTNPSELADFILLTGNDGVPKLFISAILKSRNEFLFIVATLVISYTSIRKSLSYAFIFVGGYQAATSLRSLINASKIITTVSDRSVFTFVSVSSLILIYAVCVMFCVRLIEISENSRRNSCTNEIKIICSRDSVHRLYLALLAGGSIILIRLIADALISLIS